MFSVTQNGKELDRSKYKWDEKTRVFSADEDNLVVDFSGYNYCVFKTGHYCIFNTGSDCTFHTYSDCTFNTGHYCIFKTGSDCTFKTDYGCIFKTGAHCTFKTGSSCTFATGYNCTFKTGANCTFNTSSDCTFKTEGNCFVTRYDVKGITEIPVGKTIKFNNFQVAGYTILEQEEYLKNLVNEENEYNRLREGRVISPISVLEI